MNPAIRLTDAVEAATPRLRAMSESEAGTPRAPGKWSPKEIIGHLIDSASNNHVRFVRAQFVDDLVFPGYEQDQWVAAEGYAGAAWEDLVALWWRFNLHIARVMANVPPDVARASRAKHNLDQIAFHTVPADQPVTLESFMADYVDHLEHHLEQIFPRDTMAR